MIYIVLLIGLFLAIRKPYLFVIFYGLIGSDMGSRGVTGFVELTFPNYALIMRLLFVIATIVATYNFFKRGGQRYNAKWIKLSWIMIVTMILSLSMYIYNMSMMGYLARITMAIVSYGPGVFIIWMSYADEFNHKKAFLFYSLAQCALAFIIIYGAFFGFTALNVINAGLYNDGYFYLSENNDMVALPSNFYLAFVGKNDYFIRCGQFHNANGLGFASGVLLFLLISKAFNSNENKALRVICALGAMLSFLLWCNTGTRAPMMGIMFGLVLYYLNHQSNKNKNIIPIVVVIFIIIAFVFLRSTSFYSYFFGSGADGSYASRKTLNDNTFTNIGEFFAFGCGGDIVSLVERNIDPHELPLRILCMYGIVPAILITLIALIRPIKTYIKNIHRADLYSTGLLCIVVLVGLTNNYTENVLFWLGLSESVISMTRLRNNFDTVIS